MIFQELLENLYFNTSPYSSADLKYVDNGYPHTNIQGDLLKILFSNIEPTYILECGSMIGGSAIIMAQILMSLNKSTEIVCIDPFTGDVNMWDWEKGNKESDSWRFLQLENGIPTIYKRFLANCMSAGFKNKILPINVTTTVGIRLLQRLFLQKRISSLPNYIYLDSSHEQGETYFELFLCWSLMNNGGVLFGDDWNWPSVREDVLIFSNMTKNCTDYTILNKIHKYLLGSTIINENILLYKNQWILFREINNEKMC